MQLGLGESCVLGPRHTEQVGMRRDQVLFHQEMLPEQGTKGRVEISQVKRVGQKQEGGGQGRREK